MTVTEIDLKNPELYLNRQLSLLDFNGRVLAQCLDERLPLLERVRFLFIFNSNFDEYFEIHLANLKQIINLESSKLSIDGLNPKQIFTKVRDRALELSSENYRILNKVLLPALKKEKIVMLESKDWTDEQTDWLRKFFKREVLPVITPIGLDLSHPFPRLVNKNLNFILPLEGKDAFGRQSGLGIIHAPRSLPRLVKLPKELSDGSDCFVYLSSIIQSHTEELFPGMKVKGCYQFRLTRNSDFQLDEADQGDLALAVKGKLLSRRYGAAVRLEIAEDCPEEINQYLLQQLDLEPEDLYKVNGPVNINRLSSMLEQIDRPDLSYKTFTPANPDFFNHKTNIFDLLKEKQEILLHHPFESFQPVVEFIHQAANDPKVLAIKQTLYRTVANSPMADALCEAARQGKEVTAVIELRARFDEEENIALANRLQEAGALVVYGVLAYKTHAKMSLVVRREQRSIKRYVHLGTGNYHDANAKSYTDFGYITADADIAHDVNTIFQQLTGMGKTTRLRKIFMSPFTLKKNLSDLIKQEIEHAKAGNKAQMIIKINALTDAEIIRELYAASIAGVKIDLIVRGTCCLKPGVKGVSENIKVKSVIGRFLEHERVYYFYNNGEPKLFLSSADWMERNLRFRVEVCFPISDPSLMTRIKKEALDLYLQDKAQSWILQTDGTYLPAKKANDDKFSAQMSLLKSFTNGKS